MTRISRGMTTLRTETAAMVIVVDKDRAVMGVGSGMEIVNPCLL